MISLHLMCIGIAAVALSFGESEAGTHHYRIPASKLDSAQPNQHIHKYTIPGGGEHMHKYTIPGDEHIHKYTIPNDHTYRYKLPGKNNTHSYRYKVPGMSHTHTYRYKEPGKTNTHHYRIPGQPGDGSSGQPGDGNPIPVTGGNPIPVTGGNPIPVTGGNNPNPVTGGSNPNQVTGVYSLINTMYNYFAVGGHLTGVPALDLVLLRYYVAQGPKSFCPHGGK